MYSNAGENTVHVKRCLRKWVAERASVKRERAWNVEVKRRWEVRVGV